MRYKVLAGVMIVGAGCGVSTLLAPRSGSPLQPSPRAEVTSRPNNAQFRGGKLEDCYSFRYTDRDAGAMAARCDEDGGEREITLHLSNAEADPCQQARADAGWVGGGPYPVYTVTSDAGDMCDGAEYHFTANEIDDTCTAADVDTLNGKAMVVPGYWDSNGEYHADKDTYTISCVSGAVAKCVHWGYLPDSSYIPDGGTATALLGYYRACVRAVRASYANQERYRSFTCNGAIIDIHDSLGIQLMTDAGRKVDPRGEKMSCESTWSADDAGDSLASLARPRFAFFEDNGELKDAGVPITADAGCDRGLLRIQSFPHEAPGCEQSIQIGLDGGSCLAVSAGAHDPPEVVASACSSPIKPNEQFLLINLLMVYQFQAQGDADGGRRRRCLAVAGKLAPGARIVAERCNEHRKQQFSMIGADAGADLYTLQISDLNDGGPYCLGVADRDAGDAPIVLQACDGSARQQFHFIF